MNARPAAVPSLPLAAARVAALVLESSNAP